jgi:peptidoglycan hydrolase-like protein with peptidoglycan-binding domain
MRLFVGLCLVVIGMGVGVTGIKRMDADAETAVVPTTVVTVTETKPARSESAAVPASAPIPLPARTATPTPRPELAVANARPIAVAAAGRASGMADIPPDRTTLMRELQKELIRVGCYTGSVNGIWTPATRQAMKVFTDRVNAALPVNEPDLILLALVRNHPEKTCGGSCPAGQSLAADGQCMPHAIVARATRVRAETVEKAAVEPQQQPLPPPALVKVVPLPAPPVSALALAAAAAAVPVIEGRMSIGAPIAEAPKGRTAKLASAPLPPGTKKRRAHDRYAAGPRLRAYRPLRPYRYAYRRPSGFAGLFFGSLGF